MAARSIFAEILWWDSRTIHVRCPYCSKIHKHGFGGHYDLRELRRVSRCDIGPISLYYSFKFPFSTEYGTTAYEIDKTNKRYVALGAVEEQSEDDQLGIRFAGLGLGQEEENIEALEKWEDVDEVVTINLNEQVLGQSSGIDETFTIKRIDQVLNQMLNGDVHCVQNYLDTSPNSRIFLRGIGRSGKSALLLAAGKKHSEMVKLLLERGSDPNFRRKEDSRTPLMEAALWGRYENFKLLLQHGASKDIRDSRGLKAIDLAKPCERNEEERYKRTGGEHPIHPEITFTANRMRKIIVKLLEDINDGTKVSPTKEDDFNNYSFRKPSPWTIQLVGPITEYSLPYSNKTIARLERGNQYPSIAAMSGYSHGEGHEVISGDHWTAQVRDLAQMIGHSLKTEETYDKGIPGLFNACHAEKQLMAYLVNRHVFLETDVRPRRVRQVDVVQKHVDAEGLERTLTLESEEEELPKAPLHDLSTVTPPVVLKKATILVSSPPCDDCTEFLGLLNCKLGLKISLRSC